MAGLCFAFHQDDGVAVASLPDNQPDLLIDPV